MPPLAHGLSWQAQLFPEVLSFQDWFSEHTVTPQDEGVEFFLWGQLHLSMNSSPASHFLLTPLSG